MKYKRILLKLSGESLMGEQRYGIDEKRLAEYAEQIKEVHDMGVQIGIVIGGAFSKIVTALVNMVMSVVGLFTSAVNLSELAVTLQRAGEEAPYFSLPYGAFLQSVLEFIILALCVFCALKVINRFKRKKAEEVVEAAAAAEPSKEETLLAEIRDLLKAQTETGK
mgnify:FL=1